MLSTALSDIGTTGSCRITLRRCFTSSGVRVQLGRSVMPVLRLAVRQPSGGVQAVGCWPLPPLDLCRTVR